MGNSKKARHAERNRSISPAAVIPIKRVYYPTRDASTALSMTGFFVYGLLLIVRYSLLIATCSPLTVH
jgi:hypothetical protein